MNRTRTLALALFTALLAAAPASAQAPPAFPTTDQQVAPQAAGCDPIDPSACMLPFPNDFFTTPDASTKTGVRINFNVLGMPRNAAGKPIDPTDWNRADGFSPGSLIVTHVPGMDNDAAFAQTKPVPLTDLGQYHRKNAPVVVIDATTGKRWPVWAELDHSIDANGGTDADRDLLIRPAKNFAEGHRYIVALRFMKDSKGDVLKPGAGFAAYRDGTATDARAAQMNSIFKTLDKAGIERKSLYLAWDFTVASADSLAGRMLSIRDDAFKQLGDTNLADMKVQGKAPTFTLKRIIDYTCDAGLSLPDAVIYDDQCPSADTKAGVAYDIKGTMDVPCYLSTPGCAPVHSTFVINPLTNLPQQIPGNVDKVDFECEIPKVALTNPGQSRPALYGHGLFGSYTEIHQGQLKAFMSEDNFTFCATDWAGMASADIPNVATVLTDLSNFNTLADRVQQGMLNFLYLGRLMIHPDGLCTMAPFKTASGKCVLDTQRLFYDGNSQGGIIGGALTAVAPDFNRAVLGVLGMNYSTLLTRSTDFGTGSHPPDIVTDPTNTDNIQDPTNGFEYAWPLYESYPQLNERQLIFSLMQMLWDRAEPDGYAEHMTTDPYPNTPQHRVLLMSGYGDHQVTDYSAEVEARTIGAKVLKTGMLRPWRFWEKDPWWGLEPVDFADGDTSDVSVYTVWDGGSRPAPIGNTAPTDAVDDDPHEWVRNTPWGRDMKSAFLSVDGRIVDTCATQNAGGYCDTYNYPFDGGKYAGESPLG